MNKELGDTQPREKVVAYGHFAAWDWVIGGGSYIDEFMRAQAQLRNLLIGAAVLSIVVLCGLLTLAVRALVIRPLREAGEVAAQIAHGDLTASIQVRSNDEVGTLMRGLSDMTKSLRDAVAEVRSGSDHVSSAAKQISAGNADLSQRTEEQASSLEETASSMEELTVTVKQNADNARQASALATSASDVAARGGAVVGQVVSTMASINDASKKIGDIIAVIDGIAFQTNILALNAAVEAARAGEQGRGFAVVASEVRTLAQRSHAAAVEIKGLITDSVAKVTNGTQLVDQAGRTMEEIVTAIRRVTDIMAEIAAASSEQTSGIDQINQAVVQMDQLTQQNAALVEEAAAAAESMQDQAQTLAEAVAIFKLAGTDGHPSSGGEQGETGQVPSPTASLPDHYTTRTTPPYRVKVAS
jgi:methyl-accepting chemotaxis protein